MLNLQVGYFALPCIPNVCNQAVYKCCVFCVLYCTTVQLQIEEITRRLRSGELGIPANPGDRFVRLLLLVLCFYITLSGEEI